MNRRIWKEDRLDDIIDSAPCEVTCDDNDSALRLRFALYRHLKDSASKYIFKVQENKLQVLLAKDPKFEIEEIRQ
jgi:hypothetical protein